jgi:hypothetical protein
MINIQNASLAGVYMHFIPNSEGASSPEFCAKDLLLPPDIQDSLLKYFTQNFKEPLFFNFTYTNEDFVLNPVFNYVGNVFDDPDMLFESSLKIARILHDKSRHPFIKSGELIVAHIQNILVDDEMVDAVAIFKMENSTSIIHVDRDGIKIDLTEVDGFALNKIDKACLILDTDREIGFKILNVDFSNKNQEAAYWREEFLHLTPASNDYADTTDFIKLTAKFVKSNFNPDDNTKKAEILKKSEKFLQNNETFEEQEYIDSVLEDTTLARDFAEFKRDEEISRNKPYSSEFEVSEYALKKHSKIFKSIIKLDKNFHIYVHGAADKIVKGVDENGQKYYMLYYNEES